MSLCLSHTPHCWESHDAAHFIYQGRLVATCNRLLFFSFSAQYTHCVAGNIDNFFNLFSILPLIVAARSLLQSNKHAIKSINHEFFKL